MADKMKCKVCAERMSKTILPGLDKHCMRCGGCGTVPKSKAFVDEIRRINRNPLLSANQCLEWLQRQESRR